MSSARPTAGTARPMRPPAQLGFRFRRSPAR
jgi:hypothetical protein